MTRDGKDIFDFSDTSDLPQELAARLDGKVRCGGVAFYAPLIARAGRPVTVDEVVAAVFRLTGKVAARKTVGGSLSTAATRGEIKRVARGVFAPVDWVDEPPKTKVRP